MDNLPSTSEVTLPDIENEEQSNSTKTFRIHQLPRECQVCRDPAVGYHYDVATCNGCKAFFRRTIITGRNASCKLFNKCLDRKLDSSKRICASCRFAKCEEVGMNPSAIRAEIKSEEGKMLKEAVLKKRNSSLSATSIHVEDELSVIMNKLTIAESQTEKLHNANLPENFGDFRPLLDILASHPIFEVSEIPQLSYLTHQTFPANAGYAHNGFLSVVEYAKLFNFFPKLDMESNRKIIRHSALICRNMMMCYYSLRKFNQDIVCRADGSVAGKPLKNYNGVWVEHRKIIQKTLHAFLRNDVNEVEYLLLKAIVLCNPAIPGIPRQDQIILEEERFRFTKALLSYCLKEHGHRQGPDRFVSLISIVSIMENQQKEQKNFYVVMRAFYRAPTVLVSPLYDEIMEAS